VVTVSSSLIPIDEGSYVVARSFPRSGSRRASRTFIAFSFEGLAISASVCFHDVSNASTEEVHMKQAHSTNRLSLMLMLCAPAAAGNRALLD
jgi:hypothetical protein